MLETVALFFEWVMKWWALLAAAGGALAAVWRWWLGPLIRRFRDRIAQINTIPGQVDKILAAVGPNGGKSIADKLDATRSAVLMLSAQWRAFQRSSDEPRLELGPRGHVMFVNRACEALTGYGAGDLVGRGWHGIVCPTDRSRVLRDFSHAVMDQRWFKADFGIVTAAGVNIEISFEAEPIPLGDEIVGWLVFLNTR